MKKFLQFAREEAVLSVSVILALVSAFVIPPDSAYLGYIDWHTLLLLFSLMAVMAGFQKLGLFSRIGNGLLKNIRTLRQMVWALIFLPFVFSMLITNDVGLITFVPFGLILLRLAGREELAVPVVVLQTIAANLGSMLTPMGNPQNLYLYAQCGMRLFGFLSLTLPYVLMAAACLFAAVFAIPQAPITYLPETAVHMAAGQKRQLLIYGGLFFLCLACVAKAISPVVAAAAVCLCLLVFDRELFKRVDYSLLGTFVGFFIFIGNMGRMGPFRDFLSGILTGREQLVAVLSSQLISNVPAALLLSGFTDRWKELIIGTNLGGLGTLIASMASLISYKQITRAYPAQKGRYLLLFTAANLLMLAILLIFDGIFLK